MNRVQLSFRESSEYRPGNYISFKINLSGGATTCKKVSFFISNVATSVPGIQLWEKGELLLNIGLGQTLVYSADVADIDFNLIELDNRALANELTFTLQPLQPIERDLLKAKQAPFYLDYLNCST